MNSGPVSLIDSSRSHTSVILGLAWPILLEQLLVAMVQAVDTAMVGSLGAAATAAVAINHPTTVVIDGVILAMGIGFTSVIARHIGAREWEKAESLTKQAILLVFLVMVPISCVYFSLGRLIPVWMGGQPEILRDAELYNKILAISLTFRGMTMVLTAIYRGYGNSKTPMKINVMVNTLNVVGNFLMIYPSRDLTVFGITFPMFGLGWGVAGAAVSTAISQILGGVIILTLCFAGRSQPHIHRKSGFRLDPDDLKKVLSISFPAMFERFSMGTAFIVVGKAVASLGTVALAAQNLAGTAESLCFMPGFAFGTATTTLFGQSLGAGKPDLADEFTRQTIKIGSRLMAVMSVLMFVLSNRVMRLFIPDPEVIALGGTLLKILAFIQIPQMIANIYSGALKGAGDSRSPFLITLISMWGVRIAGTLICVRLLHLGLVSTTVSMCTDNCVRCLLFHLRYRQGTWRKASRYSESV